VLGLLGGGLAFVVVGVLPAPAVDFEPLAASRGAVFLPVENRVFLESLAALAKHGDSIGEDLGGVNPWATRPLTFVALWATIRHGTENDFRR